MGISLVFLLCGCTASTSSVSGIFRMTVLDVGKADAILLQTENHTAVIDAGEKEDGKKIVSALHEQGIDKIDVLLITHFDRDHVGGAAKVIQDMQIGAVYQSDYDNDGPQRQEYIKAMAEKGISPQTVTEPFSFTMDDAVFTLYPPVRADYEEDNDFSLAVLVRHGKHTFLLTGDAEKERIKEFLNIPELRGITVLKMPHHGGYEDNTEAFLNMTDPSCAVITCSDKNPPSNETLTALADIGCGIYLTSYGTVVVESDGTDISVIQETEQNG